MSDECDQTQEREERLSELFARMRPPVNINVEGNGYCYYCGEPVQFGRWCSLECRDGDERDTL